MPELQQIPIVPNGLRYWILPDARKEKTITVGDVTLSGNSNDKEPPLQGRVVAVGDADMEVEALVMPEEIVTRRRVPCCKYKRGALVIFGKYAGSPHTFEGVEYTILHEDEILGYVIETPFDPNDPTDLS